MSKEWADLLPAKLRSLGKKLVEAPHAEIAWPVQQGEQLIESLRSNRHAILGGDLYIRKDSTFMPLYATWHCNLKAGELWSTYIERSCNEALQFVARAGKETWFVIVASSSPTVEHVAESRGR